MAQQNMAPQQPMMPPAGPPAEMVLRQRERLQLTDDQVKRLEALSKSQRDALKPDRASMLRARADLVEAEDKDNFGQQRSALEKLAKIRIDRMMTMRQAMKETRDILTPEQRDRLPNRPMRGMGGRGGGGMAAMMQPGRGGAPVRRPPANPPAP
jgi:Spy/CpxP family protein refolding chaperone